MLKISEWNLSNIYAANKVLQLFFFITYAKNRIK
jgi:hypothetical protein